MVHGRSTESPSCLSRNWMSPHTWTQKSQKGRQFSVFFLNELVTCMFWCFIFVLGCCLSFSNTPENVIAIFEFFWRVFSNPPHRPFNKTSVLLFHYIFIITWVILLRTPKTLYSKIVQNHKNNTTTWNTKCNSPNTQWMTSRIQRWWMVVIFTSMPFFLNAEGRQTNASWQHAQKNLKMGVRMTLTKTLRSSAF